MIYLISSFLRCSMYKDKVILSLLANIASRLLNSADYYTIFTRHKVVAMACNLIMTIIGVLTFTVHVLVHEVVYGPL